MDKPHAVGLLRLKLTDILAIFRMYGMDVYFPEVVEEIIRSALEFHDRLSEAEHK